VITTTKARCKQPNGTERAWFYAREQAVQFALDPANVNYRGDVAHKCAQCDLWHLSRPEWLEPRFTPTDAQFLEDTGIAVPQRMPEYFRCVSCGCVMREDIEFLILRNVDIHCAGPCGPELAQ
jgi:hypothetical protein